MFLPKAVLPAPSPKSVDGISILQAAQAEKHNRFQLFSFVHISHLNIQQVFLALRLHHLRHHHAGVSQIIAHLDFYNVLLAGISAPTLLS